MERYFSEWKTIRASLPQGSDQASLLYNVCVADISKLPGIEVSQFADDTAAQALNKTSTMQYGMCRSTC